MLIADSYQGAKEIKPYLLESEALRLLVLAAVDDCVTLLLLLLLLCEGGAEVVVACEGAARGVST